MNRRLHNWAARLSLALAACAAAAGLTSVSAVAQTRTLTNVATLSWDGTNGRVSRDSNRVDIAVSIVAAPSTVSLLALDPNGTTGGMLEGTRCAGAPMSIPPAYAGALAGTPATSASRAYRAGEPLLFAIDSPSANLDPAAADRLAVTVTTDLGDSEQLTLLESAPDSGRFLGLIPTLAGVAPVSGDCRLTVHGGNALRLTFRDAGGVLGTSSADILIDPFGIVFDSATGVPVSGARVMIVDADTGLPAQVFGDDGASGYPSTMITGQAVNDAGGTRYTFAAGEFRFPLLRPGRYRILLEPPAPYTAPSVVQPPELAGLARPDGGPLAIVAGSYGAAFVLNTPAPVRIDIPVDAPAAGLLLTKEASRAVAEPGDVLQFRLTVRNPDARRATGTVTVTDTLPPEMRLRADSVRLDGTRVAAASADGRRFTVPVPALRPGASALLTYLVEVLPGARDGTALNLASAADDRGNASPVADAAVRITRELIAGRMTIVGRVVEATCAVDPRAAKGIGGVRVMLEDGSYAVTDRDGRYHFEGVRPGTHVVQLDESTLPAPLVTRSCGGTTRNAGRAWSRFVEGTGGALHRVDFRAAPGARVVPAAAAPVARPAPLADAEAAGAGRDWLAGEGPGIAWLFPGDSHNPRARVVRVVVKHAPGQTIRLLADGKPVGPLAIEGTTKSGDGLVAATAWRALPIEGDTLRLSAEVLNADGSVAARLTRDVHYSATPARAELISARSRLLADGVSRPVIAVRLTDRRGRPLHHGSVGEFTVPAPYLPAVEADAQTARQLSGLERAQPFWRVEGDEGIAFIELEPTTASGALSVDFRFKDGERVRDQRLDAWLSPGDRPWTVVGFAAGTVGYNRLSRGLEGLDRDTDTVELGGRAALYAKGRVRGRWLLTFAYDTGKREDDARFGGVIDPEAYYTVYADRTERRYDAQSVRKLYVKLERPQFYALFGDYETGITEPELTRYARALNGLKAEYRGPRLSALAFAADTPTRHRRDEIQGNGLSGPYALRAGDVLPNSEVVEIQTRDRFRSNVIVATRRLSRYVDYDIDYLAGTIRFKEPILSRGSGLDPQIIVADYEVHGVGGRETNAGARAGWRNGAETLKVNATAIREGDGPGATALGGVDVTWRPTPATEVRAEAAVSDADRGAGDPTLPAAEAVRHAWLIEAEHHAGAVDLLAYAREQEAGFGTGQVNAAENGARKIGFDGRLRLTGQFAVSGSAWHEDYLDSDRRRTAARGLLEYRGAGADLRAGLVFADDRLGSGATRQSTLVQLGAAKRLFGNRLELDANTEFALGGEDESVDFPSRHRLGARWAVSDAVALVGSYEIADGDAVEARTARLGFDLKPWAGARFALTGGNQDIAEYGPRSFAAFGLSQSLALGKRWTVDLTLDGNRTLGGIDPAAVLNPAQPVASGGFIGDGSLITEDFTAVTAGATYRGERWSATGRAEFREGDRGDRWGVQAAALRQIGEGRAVGGAVDWHVADGLGGLRTETRGAAVSWAHRPAGSDLSFLNKLEARDDRVRGAVAGLPGPIGGAPLLVSGDARSTRIVNSLSLNWQPVREDDDGTWTERAEGSLFWGTRYASERLGADDVEGWSNLIGADLRFNISDTLDIGAAASVRTVAGADAVSWAAGPSVGLTPFTNGWLSVGYNVAGFSDRDFEASRYTRSGPYVTLRMKFDQLSLADLTGARPRR